MSKNKKVSIVEKITHPTEVQEVISRGVDFDIDTTRSIPVVEESVSRGTVIYTTDKIFTDMEIITEQSMIIAKQFKLTFEGIKLTLPSLLMNISKVLVFVKSIKPNVEIILETIKD